MKRCRIVGKGLIGLGLSIVSNCAYDSAAAQPPAPPATQEARAATTVPEIAEGKEAFGSKKVRRAIGDPSRDVPGRRCQFAAGWIGHLPLSPSFEEQRAWPQRLPHKLRGMVVCSV